MVMKGFMDCVGNRKLRNCPLPCWANLSITCLRPSHTVHFVCSKEHVHRKLIKWKCHELFHRCRKFHPFQDLKHSGWFSIRFIFNIAFISIFHQCQLWTEFKMCIPIDSRLCFFLWLLDKFNLDKMRNGQNKLCQWSRIYLFSVSMLSWIRVQSICNRLMSMSRKIMGNQTEWQLIRCQKFIESKNVV